MKPLIANLKSLFQCRFQWIYIVMIVAMISRTAVSVIIDQPPKVIHDFFQFSPLYCFLLGIGVGTLITDIWNKPFAFCLPGQKSFSRQSILIVWLIIITPICVAWLFSLNRNSISYGLFIELLSLISLSYWSGLWVLFKGKKIIAYPALILSTLILIYSSLAIDKAEAFITRYPSAITIISFLLCYLVYHYMNQIELHDFSSSNTPTMFAYNKKAFKKIELATMYKSKDRRASTVAESANVYFSERIKSHQKSSHLAALWGRVYLTLGQFLPRFWVFGLIGTLFPFGLACFIVHSPGLEPALFEIIFLIMAFLFSAIVFSGQRNNLFLITGRREIFLSRIVELCVHALIFLFLILVPILLYKVILTSVPTFSLFGMTFSTINVPVRWTLLFIPLILVPLLGSVFIFFKDHFILLILALILSISFMAIFDAIMSISQEHMSFMLISIIYLSVMAVVWGSHIAAVYYDSMKRSLC